MSIEVLPVLEALVGIPALIAVVINLLKAVKVVGKGKAALWSKVANVVVFSALYLLATYKPDMDILFLDNIARTVADRPHRRLHLPRCRRYGSVRRAIPHDGNTDSARQDPLRRCQQFPGLADNAGTSCSGSNQCPAANSCPESVFIISFR